MDSFTIISCSSVALNAEVHIIHTSILSRFLNFSLGYTTRVAIKHQQNGESLFLSFHRKKTTKGQFCLQGIILSKETGAGVCVKTNTSFAGKSD